MTRKNAITHLAHKIIRCKTCGERKADGVCVTALEMATIALGKQEPKKIREENGWIYCPMCEMLQPPIDMHKYCCRCGQRLLWWDEEEEK